MRILTWNIHRHRGGTADQAAAVVARVTRGPTPPEVILLQEVWLGEAFVEALRSAFREAGYDMHVARPEVGAAGAKDYGCVVAARWALRPVDMPTSGARGSSEWSHLIAAAEVRHDVRPFIAFSVHIPNGSGNGWAKIDALQHLAVVLAERGDRPRVVGGDFNEPKRFTATGLESFRYRPDTPDATFTRPGTGAARTKGTYGEWQTAVERILGPSGHAGVARVCPSAGADDTTHVVRRGGLELARNFDHVLVSDEFVGATVTYEHDVRTDAGSDGAASDHSIVVVTTRYP